jgi:hypothetical protein
MIVVVPEQGYGAQIGSFHEPMRDQAERVIQAELNSIAPYEHRSRPVKTDKTPAADTHPADELHHLSSVGHGSLLTPAMDKEYAGACRWEPRSVRDKNFFSFERTVVSPLWPG